MKAISITRPLGELEHLTPEELIVYKARISSPHRQHLHETGHALLRYCLTHGHWSVFDMVHLTIEVETSRAIAAQMLRHHSFRFQEFSQRYAAVKDINFDGLEVRVKAEGGNRQGSGVAAHRLSNLAEKVCRDAAANYRLMLHEDAAPESARMVLPLATPTTLYMCGSVRSWITYFWQRCAPDAQKEHREVAEGCRDIFAQHFPVCHKLATEGQMRYTTNNPTP
jgi:thymidylate synthase (FAD)